KNQETLQKELETYQALSNQLNTHKKQHMREARAEAKKLVAEANQQIENAIREIKESQADKQKTKESRAVVEKLKTGLLKADKEDWAVGRREEAPLEYIQAPGDIDEGESV